MVPSLVSIRSGSGSGRMQNAKANNPIRRRAGGTGGKASEDFLSSIRRLSPLV